MVVVILRCYGKMDTTASSSFDDCFQVDPICVHSYAFDTSALEQRATREVIVTKLAI